ncbi:hypothetical protein FIBSPDRAFT_1035743 [Athelia psychrophila]|uniref:Uncharacterized protein n=1 Tax=Athelia psychrophila TaxID=1759441 RepID=A0A166WGD2_9AGAM|nr:hypothetical protein FIBSPDRAFT_1035743 [Fibularhizoctonia sp. CBS 109695]
MLRHWSLQGLLLGSKRVNGQLQRYPSLARCYAIQSLDPSKFQPSDYVSLTGVEPTVFTRDSAFTLRYSRSQLEPSPTHTPFPENSSGFLYLSSSPGKPQSAWEIRFRVTDGNAPQSFESGADLLCPDHKPWRIPLRALGTKKYPALRELLLRDGLVNHALLHLKPYNFKQHIQTLDPSRLQPSDHLNLSGAPTAGIYVRESACRITYTEKNRLLVPFPDNARGFLYLHSPTAGSKAMWEIRFRVTDSNCPSTFKAGSDLVYPNKTTWAISLGSLRARRPEYAPLRNLLIREGLDVDALLGDTGFTKKKKATSRPLIDHTLAQRFRMDFQTCIFTPAFISSGVGLLEFNIQRVFDVMNTRRLSPYSGSAWCRFEAHSSPGSAQPDQLGIRILEMITPVTVSNPEFAHRIPVPQEGRLVMKYTKCGPNNTGKQGLSPRTLDPRPWTLNAQMTEHPVIQAILRDAAT